MKWLYLWLAYLFGRVTEHEFGPEAGALLFFCVVILFAGIILWRSNVPARVRFKFSSLILSLPYIGKFAFDHGLKNFRPGSEPDGFRGIKWGTEFLNAFSNLEKIKRFKPIS
jgi:hypothetical protein